MMTHARNNLNAARVGNSYAEVHGLYWNLTGLFTKFDPNWIFFF